jgi:hypothetical protein
MRNIQWSRNRGLNALTGIVAAIVAMACIMPPDHGIIATAKANDAENLAIPLPRPRPVIRVPRPRLGTFPGKTLLMEFESAPFPYDGKNPVSGQPFFNVFYEGRFGRRGARGQVYWESETYTDPRVLLHIPKGFDIRKPAVIVVFFHGHGAKIDRDVRDRQQVAAQITRSDANAVVVAPQFAVNAADSAPGAFWEPGFFDEFLSEASEQLALMLGQPKAVRTFFKLPIIFVSYSGGFVPTAWSLRLGHIKDRLRGIVLFTANSNISRSGSCRTARASSSAAISAPRGHAILNCSAISQSMASRSRSRSMAPSSPAAWYSSPDIPRIRIATT